MGKYSLTAIKRKPESLILQATEGSIEAPCITKEDNDFARKFAFSKLGQRPEPKKVRRLISTYDLIHYPSRYFDSYLETEGGEKVTVTHSFWSGVEFWIGNESHDFRNKGTFVVDSIDSTAQDKFDFQFKEIVKTILDNILTNREEEYQVALEEQQKEIQSAQERFQAALKDFKLWTITRDNELICKLFQIETGKWTKDILHEDNLGFFSQEAMDNIVDNYEKLKG